MWDYYDIKKAKFGTGISSEETNKKIEEDFRTTISDISSVETKLRRLVQQVGGVDGEEKRKKINKSIALLKEALKLLKEV